MADPKKPAEVQKEFYAFVDKLGDKGKELAALAKEYFKEGTEFTQENAKAFLNYAEEKMDKTSFASIKADVVEFGKNLSESSDGVFKWLGDTAKKIGNSTPGLVAGGISAALVFALTFGMIEPTGWVGNIFATCIAVGISTLVVPMAAVAASEWWHETEKPAPGKGRSPQVAPSGPVQQPQRGAEPDPVVTPPDPRLPIVNPRTQGTVPPR